MFIFTLHQGNHQGHNVGYGRTGWARLRAGLRWPGCYRRRFWSLQVTREVRAKISCSVVGYVANRK